MNGKSISRGVRFVSHSELTKLLQIGSVTKDAAIGAATGTAGHTVGKLVGTVINRVKGETVAVEAEVGADARAAKALYGCFTAGTDISTS